MYLYLPLEVLLIFILFLGMCLLDENFLQQHRCIQNRMTVMVKIVLPIVNNILENLACYMGNHDLVFSFEVWIINSHRVGFWDYLSV